MSKDYLLNNNTFFNYFLKCANSFKFINGVCKSFQMWNAWENYISFVKPNWHHSESSIWRHLIFLTFSFFFFFVFAKLQWVCLLWEGSYPQMIPKAKAKVELKPRGVQPFKANTIILIFGLEPTSLKISHLKVCFGNIFAKFTLAEYSCFFRFYNLLH